MLRFLISAAFALSIAYDVAYSQRSTAVVSPPLPAAAAAPMEVEPGSAAENSEPVDPGTTEDTEAAKKKAEEEQKKAQRKQKLQKLTFDRRPSAILIEWAKSNEKPAPDDKPESEDADGQPKDPPDSDTEDETPKPDPFDEQLKQFRRDVTLGNWAGVKEFLGSLSEDEAKIAYGQLLRSLCSVPKGVPAGLPPELQAQVAELVQSRQSSSNRAFQERNRFSFDDVIALADAAPHDLDTAAISSLGNLLRMAIQDGNTVGLLLPRLHQEISKPPEQAVLTKRQAAQLLMASGQAVEAGEFLPSVDEARERKDHQALNLLARYYLALFQKEKEPEHLEKAWHVTQAVFALGDIKEDERQEALRRAVELAPKVGEELGQTWLTESFTSEPQRGIEIIAAIGSAAATGLQTHQRDASFRLNSLRLQTTAVEALLEASVERADQWQTMLDLLAGNWLREADVSYQRDQSASMGPRMRRDRYGNIFYYDEMEATNMPNRSNSLQAIKTSELLEIKPGPRWLERVSESIRPKFDMMFAQLYLKVNEEDLAFKLTIRDVWRQRGDLRFTLARTDWQSVLQRVFCNTGAYALAQPTLWRA